MIRAAIVGLGTWGRNLVSSVQGRSECIQFTAGATRTPGKAADFAGRHGIRMLSSYEAVLADPDVDAVVIATPPAATAALVRGARSPRATPRASRSRSATTGGSSRRCAR